MRGEILVHAKAPLNSSLKYSFSFNGGLLTKPSAPQMKNWTDPISSKGYVLCKLFMILHSYLYNLFFWLDEAPRNLPVRASRYCQRIVNKRKGWRGWVWIDFFIVTIRGNLTFKKRLKRLGVDWFLYCHNQRESDIQENVVRSSSVLYLGLLMKYHVAI